MKTILTPIYLEDESEITAIILLSVPRPNIKVESGLVEIHQPSRDLENLLYQFNEYNQETSLADAKDNLLKRLQDTEMSYISDLQFIEDHIS